MEKKVIISGTGEVVYSDNPNKLVHMVFNGGKQILFPLSSNGIYCNPDFLQSDKIKNSEFLGELMKVAAYIRPRTTTICLKNDDNRYIIATDKDIREILGLSEKKFRNFMKEMQENNIIKRQRFIHGDFYHYEYMINPSYINFLLNRITYSDFLVWKEDLICFYSSDEIEYWKIKMRRSYAEECIEALYDGEDAVKHRKLIKDFENFAKREWAGIRTPRGK